MNKKVLPAIILVLVAAVAAAYFMKQHTLPSASPVQEVIDTPQQSKYNNAEFKETSVAVNQPAKRMSPGSKTYSNSKLGFSFPYPANWYQNGKEEEAVNLSGAVTVITINFADSVLQTTLALEYHLAPKGAELYRYAVSQGRGINTEVAGNKAIETNTIIDKDGRGRPVKPAERLIVVDFLDKKQTGEIEFQFRTPLPDDAEVAKFRQLLSGFKFIG